MSSSGYRSLLRWARELGEPAFTVEGTGSYGAGLVRFLEQAGVPAYECERPRRQERRRGQNDLIDADLAARQLLSGEGLSIPRGGGPREDLRLLLLERRSAVQARSAALNQLRALLVTAPDHLRKQLETRSGKRLAKAAARLSPGKTTVSDVMRRLGRRISHLSDELAETEHALAELAPDLLNECGVGPVCAAQLLVSTGNPARMRNEPPSPHSPAPAPSKPQAATSDGTASTAAATANSTGPSTSSHPNGPTTTPKPPATTNDSSQPAKPAEKHAAVSNAPSPATSTNASAKYQPTP